MPRPLAVHLSGVSALVRRVSPPLKPAAPTRTGALGAVLSALMLWRPLLALKVRLWILLCARNGDQGLRWRKYGTCMLQAQFGTTAGNCASHRSRGRKLVAYWRGSHTGFGLQHKLQSWPINAAQAWILIFWRSIQSSSWLKMTAHKPERFTELATGATLTHISFLETSVWRLRRIAPELLVR